MDIESLPVPVLGEIFSNLRDVLILRQVCRTFKNVVDYSPKLIKNYAIKAEKIEFDEKTSISPYFNELKFQEIMCGKIFKFNSSFQHLDKITSISIDIEKTCCATLLHCLVTSVPNLQDLCIYLRDDSHLCCKVEKLEYKPSSKLRSLSIDSATHTSYLSGILEMFSKIRSIKILNISSDYEFDFPADAVWELDELRINILGEIPLTFDIGGVNVAFFEKQQPTLKKLHFIGLDDNLNFIARKFPNLYNLIIDYPNHLLDEFLIKNNNLKELGIFSTYQDSSEFYVNVLNHFNSIEKLYIEPFGLLPPLSVPIQLPFLKHLYCGELTENFLKSVRAPQLISLTIEDEMEEIEIEDMADENFKNLKNLCLKYVKSVEWINQFISKCPCLRDLKLGQLEVDETVINGFLEISPNLERLGVLEENFIGSREDILTKVNKKRFTLQVYDKFKSMKKFPLSYKDKSERFDCFCGDYFYLY